MDAKGPARHRCCESAERSRTTDANESNSRLEGARTSANRRPRAKLLKARTESLVGGLRRLDEEMVEAQKLEHPDQSESAQSVQKERSCSVWGRATGLIVVATT